MSVSATAPAESVEVTTPTSVRRWPGHVVFVALALAAAAYMTHGLLGDPYTTGLARNLGDQAFFEWVLGYGREVLTHGADPFHTTLMNAPNSVNLAANTSIAAYIVLFAPVTVLLGPQVSFAAILTLNLAGGAIAFYCFSLRYLTSRRAAAAVAAMFYAFAPGFVSHANGHLNWSAAWIGPVVLWWVLKLREPGRWLRNGVVLGLLIATCFTIAAEGLFFTALASGVFLITWALAKTTRSEARTALPTVLAGLGVTAAVAGVLLAYPLYMHFAGPQTFSGTGFNQRHYVEDVVSYVSYSERTLAAWAGLDSASLAPNPTEQTSFFGLPMIILVVAGFVLLWRRSDAGRRATLRALIVVASTFTVLSWGPRLQFLEHETSFVLPYAALARLPLFDSALPGRFALVVAGAFAVVLALLADRLLSDRGLSSTVQTSFAASFAVALVPLIPLPLLTWERAAEPQFIANGTWKRYVTEGGTISALPFASNMSADAMRWQAYTMARGGRQFRIPDGYFLGPGGPNGTGRLGAPFRQTDWLLFRSSSYGEIWSIGDADRQRTREDLAYWNIQALFLADRVTGAEGPDFRSALEITARDLLGEPERVDDVLVWRIRPGVDPVARGR